VETENSPLMYGLPSGQFIHRLYVLFVLLLLLFLFYFILYIFLFIVLCVFLYFIITAALCVLINGMNEWMDGWNGVLKTDRCSPARCGEDEIRRNNYRRIHRARCGRGERIHHCRTNTRSDLQTIRQYAVYISVNFIIVIAIHLVNR